MKNMKLYMLCGVLVLGLAACQAQKEPVTPLPTGEAAVEAQASVSISAHGKWKRPCRQSGSHSHRNRNTLFLHRSRKGYGSDFVL